MKYMIINELIKLIENINIKVIPENENPRKVVTIVEKIFSLNEQQKSKWIKLLTAKQILQRLLIALAELKANKTSENLLNEIRQITKLKQMKH